MMKVFVTGGTGLIGGALVDTLLQRGDEPIVLSRDAGRATERLGRDVLIVEGDPQQPGDWCAKIDGCDAVVNLAGEPIFGKRWNAEQKKRLVDSRVDSTRNIVQAIGAAKARPKVMVNASAVGYYGDVPENEVTEQSPQGGDYLAQICGAWEAAAKQVMPYGVRLVLIRIGVVLARDGGAVKQMLLPFKLGLGGPVGFGRQWVSWIHLDDIVRVIVAALDNRNLEGVVNATAPEPVRNKEFSQCLAAALHRPCLFPVPPFMLRLMFGEVAFVVTTGQKVLPTRLLAEDFAFRFPRCGDAMQDLFGRRAQTTAAPANNDSAE
jgi:uncharacterized protein (TIGR01777 family)